MADLETVERALQRAAKAAKGGDKATLTRKTLLETLLPHLDAARPVRSLDLDVAARQELRDLALLTAKPTLYVANVAEDGFADNPHLLKVGEIARAEGAEIVVVCNQIEAELAELDAEDRRAFLADLGLEEPGLNRVIRAGYRLLRLHTFFTAGVKEVRAWTLAVGATAPQAAGCIHSDFEKGFIRAEVVGYEDFVHYRGEAGAREAGKWRLEGKDYVVQEGDIIHFRFNV